MDCNKKIRSYTQGGNDFTMLNQYEDVINVKDLCEILKIGRNRAYELLHTGAIPSFRLGRNWKIPRISVEDYLYRQAHPESIIEKGCKKKMRKIH